MPLKVEVDVAIMADTAAGTVMETEKAETMAGLGVAA